MNLKETFKKMTRKWGQDDCWVYGTKCVIIKMEGGYYLKWPDWLLCLARTSGANSCVAELGHGGCHGGGHGGSCDAVFPRIPPPALAALATQLVAETASERGQQGLPEACVHETVNDGVDAGWWVRQQVDEGDGCSWEGFGGRLQVERFPGVGRVQGHPADEEEGHDHHEHADDSLLGLELGLWRVAPGTCGFGRGIATWGREGGELHTGGRFFRHLNVATIVVIIWPCSSPSYAVFLAWGSKFTHWQDI